MANAKDPISEGRQLVKRSPDETATGHRPILAMDRRHARFASRINYRANVVTQSNVLARLGEEGLMFELEWRLVRGWITRLITRRLMPQV